MERRRKEEEKKIKREEEEKKKKEEEEKRNQERLKEIDKQRKEKEKENKRKKEEENKIKREEERKKKEEDEERQIKINEERRKKEEEKKRKREAEEKRKKEEEERKKKEDEERRKKEEKRNKKKKQILERQEQLRKNQINHNIKETKNNEEKIKQILEDMYALGEIMTEEIKEEKEKEPEKFITIQEATKEEKVNEAEFCLGILAKNLENIGITTAIEKEQKNDEESISQSNTILQFIMSGMIEKKKYNLHFDLGEKRNEELLYNKLEQEKFNNKLRKKLSLEYNIAEDKIIITNPEKGSYQIQVIFQSDEFNEPNLDINKLREKCENDEDFKEISYLKEIHTQLIMKGCKLNKNMLDSRGNKEEGWSEGKKRGGFDYFPPLGWKGFGLNVLDKYDDGNNDWIANNGNQNEWAVAYHGIGVKLGATKQIEKDGKLVEVPLELEDVTNRIITGGFKVGAAHVCKDHNDLNHPGQKVGKGIYCSPSPKVLESYAKFAKSWSNINGKQYMMGFMMRVKPDKIRISERRRDYWVLNATTDEMRPYRILIKENEYNFITGEIEIKEEDVNKEIRIINSYENFKRENNWINNIDEYKYVNKKEIENCIININNRRIPFSYYHKFERTGIYEIKYIFKSNINSLSCMFWGCESLTKLNLSYFNTYDSTNMFCMFRGCSSLSNLDLSSFRTQNVTNMVSLFSNCTSLSSINISNFNTLNVIDMRSMFRKCKSLEKLDLSHLNTQNVINMSYMFEGCNSLSYLNLSNFNAQNVIYMNYMFDGCFSLSKQNMITQDNKILNKLS